MTGGEKTPQRELKKKLAWFVAIWVASVVALLVVAMLIRLMLRY